MVESMRPDVLEVYGAGESIMPMVDSMAEKGLVFGSVWAQSSHSNYADIAALSGQYSLRSESIHFYPKHATYPKSLPWDHLANYGYRSGAFSSGDDNWGRMLNYLRSENLSVYNHAGDDTGKNGDVEGNDEILELSVESDKTQVNFTSFMVGEERAFGKSRLDEETTQEALNWLKENDRDCLLYTSPSPRDGLLSRMPSSA